VRWVKKGPATEAGRGEWSLWGGKELLERSTPLFDACAVALGTFDGVHIGHRQIFEQAVALARACGWPAVAFTFDRHPAATIAPSRRPPLLTTFQRRIALILEAGIAHVVVVRFDEEFSRVPAEEFARRILSRALGAKAVVVGRDFRFGSGARGDVGLLERMASDLGYTLRVVPPVTVGGEKVSSTAIRSFVAKGDVEMAARLLGRPYLLEGVVVHGEARGRTLGYPTANLAVSEELLVPAEGVYLTKAHDREAGLGPFPGLTAIGTRPSFGPGARSIETHLLDYQGDLYGRRLSLEFCARLRDISAFEGAESLVRQIEVDVAQARAFFGLGAV